MNREVYDVQAHLSRKIGISVFAPELYLRYVGENVLDPVSKLNS